MKKLSIFLLAIFSLLSPAVARAQLGCINWYDNTSTLLGCVKNWQGGTGLTCTLTSGKVTCTAAGGSTVGLAGAYNGGAVAADQTMLIQAGKGGPAIFKANAAATGNLFQAQTSTGTGVFSISDGSVTETLTQPARTSGSPIALNFIGGSHTTLAASAEATDIDFNLARTVQFSTGALTTQRALLVEAPTYAFVGASTLTNAATLAITGAPVAGTNATITNPYALWVQGGASRFDGALTLSGTQIGTYSLGGTPTLASNLSVTSGNFISVATNSATVPPAITWTGVTFLNAWVNYGAPFDGVGYYKDAMGWVHLRGAAKSGTTATVAFTLPVGYRPVSQRNFASGASGGAQIAIIAANGDVTPNDSTGTAVTTHCEFDNILFQAEQ